MTSAVLISDMYGRTGDLSYLHAWTAWLAEREIAVQVVFVDELLPECYAALDEAGAEPTPPLHARITAPDAVALAQARLLNGLSEIRPGLILGFSYGGYLLAGIREQLGGAVQLVCISATRLRVLLPLPRPPLLHALFGADDPHRPDWRLPSLASPYLQAADLPGHGHDLYRFPEACAGHVDEVLAALRTASPSVPRG